MNAGHCPTGNDTPSRDSTAPDAARRAGRPRSKAAHRAILAATLHILAEDGYEGVSMERVASRAGVSKPTVYLRWSNRTELVVDALVELAPLDFGGIARQGTDDLPLLAARIVRWLADSPIGQALPAVLAALSRHPELSARLRETIIEPRRAAIRALLARGVWDGRLDPDLDLELAVDIVVGPLLYHWLAAGNLPDEVTCQRIVRLALRALAR